jgi:hypothetical protein
MLTTPAFAVAPGKLAPRSARNATHRKLFNEKNELAITKTPIKETQKVRSFGLKRLNILA